jgi:hypothetical protein
VTKGSGLCRIDAVEAGELTVDFFAPQPVMSVKYAYADSRTAQRMGFSHKNKWGDAVVAKLVELRELIEAEICAERFEGGAESAPQETSQRAEDVPSL